MKIVFAYNVYLRHKQMIGGAEMGRQVIMRLSAGI